MRGFDSKDSAAATMRWFRRLKHCGVIGSSLVLSFCVGLPACAQGLKQPSIPHLVDKGVLFPPSQPSAMARQDDSALATIRSYQKTVGTTAWTDMEATGEMIPNALPDGRIASQGATLWVLGHRAYRLDIQTKVGLISIRMLDENGAMQRPNGRVTSMDARDAATGLLAFPQLQDPAFPTGDIILIDRGTVPVDGTALHRITVEAPWKNSLTNGQQQKGIGITDLYFDPATNLLIKSANILHGTDPRLARYMKVVTYGDYRAINGNQIPFLLSESVNGQRVWALQLNRVLFNQNMKQTDFLF